MARTEGGHKIEGRDRLSQISLRWGTHTRTYLTPTTRVSTQASDLYDLGTNIARHSRSPLTVPSRQSLAVVYASYQALPEPTNHPKHARRHSAGLEPSLAMDTAIA